MSGCRQYQTVIGWRTTTTRVPRAPASSAILSRLVRVRTRCSAIWRASRSPSVCDENVVHWCMSTSPKRALITLRMAAKAAEYSSIRFEKACKRFSDRG